MARKSPVSQMKLSFCEPVWVATAAPWCLRYLTDKGPKYGGGVDTESLCGRVKPPHGWDVEVPVTQDRLDREGHTCPRCLQVLKESRDG